MKFGKKTKPYKGDKWGSTYRHIMVLDDTHPKNRLPEMTGYSKDQGIPEPLDKTYLLLKQVRLCMEWIEDGRSLCTGLSKRPDMRYWWDKSHPILTLYRPARSEREKDYEVHSFEDVPGEVEKEIKQLYQLLRDGKKIADAPGRTSSHQGKSFDKTLERHSVYGTFTDPDGLREYCANKRKEGYEYGMLADFHRKYTGIWFAK